ncbi:MotE family protein [Hyphomonas johnsonii]|jgi:flagellar motility protein MotE (MotC chaperone)|uniref:Magnesium transporter MgtE intracellular domain-containing protein n=1 Tax=Hyphomonas johnsonii MHS-2 TaxID=1280950 RepID=A0A059FNV6_9PROT|nr:hypothetical protein [Hyphomonas johnsonii]KCZ92206.1 hypothetical protein HJO_09229 [Hyphomonas johnsonii MHS-2]
MKALDKRSSYVLITLGFLFTVGAAVRFLPNNLATAESTEATASAASATATTAADPEAAASPAPAVQAIDQVCFTAETAALLAKDQEKITTQEEDLRELELTLQARQQDLENRSAELEALQASLDARWQEMQTVSDDDLVHLARMYGTMKPDQAAAIFNQMDPDFAGSFLRLMRSEQAGLILANMETRKAYAVSVKLAELNEDVRNSATPTAPPN